MQGAAFGMQGFAMSKGEFRCFSSNCIVIKLIA